MINIILYNLIFYNKYKIFLTSLLNSILYNSFIFNLGRGALSQVTANGTRSKEEIASKMLEYNKAGRKQLAGLVKRTNDERDVFVGEAILGGGD